VNGPSSRRYRRPAQPDPEHTVEYPRRAGDPSSEPQSWSEGWQQESQEGGPLPAPLFASGQDETVADGSPVDPDAPWTGTPMEPADDDLDLLAVSNRRPSRLTITLIAGILAAVAFVGGVQAQKQWGGSSAAAATGAPGGAAGFQRGGGGGYGGGAAGFGGAGAGATGGAAAGGGAAAADTPAIVGTVVKVSGTTVTVKNFAGKTVTVKVPAGTTVSLSSTLSLTGLKAGTSVSVVGTTGSDGSITASAVTARK
jgi:hypothetical protein